MEDLYREAILDHYQNPRNYGVLENATLSHEEDNPVCGDHIRLDLVVDGDRVSDVRFSGQGCAISQASASMLTEEMVGKTLDELKALDKDFILDMLGIPLGPVRLKCALLSLKVLKAGLYGIKGWPGDEDDE
ncbi:MAG: SUF system NifU family Fe-S cluster assembly protein [Thermoflexales bacterium]|nr:SUF system NifU family Fe-S cluster assembly protein [Thermoflexales bacterium]